MTKTDQRAAPRLEVNVAATLQMLGFSAAANGEAMAVAVLDASEFGMRLQTAAPMNAGQAVKIEMGDAMFLGEVCYCAAAAEGFNLGIVIRECLTGLASLQHLIRALRPESVHELERSR